MCFEEQNDNIQGQIFEHISCQMETKCVYHPSNIFHIMHYINLIEKSYNQTLC